KTYITIEDVKQLAIDRGGKLLSDIYMNTQEKLKFECYLEHIFFISVNHIKNGNWCPKCVIYIGESITKNIMEIFFCCEFGKVKPNWLEGLELDGYNDELKIAFEYDGEQHYKVIKRYHKTTEDFERQVQRDER